MTDMDKHKHSSMARQLRNKAQNFEVTLPEIGGNLNLFNTAAISQYKHLRQRT